MKNKAKVMLKGADKTFMKCKINLHEKNLTERHLIKITVFNIMGCDNKGVI